ncbi:hypothetical protein [Pricia sp.]|uniref:hypothetical protein n=1 Tax=Pricia sp. TaxID=2268138 RepID=UPI003594220B
MKNIFLILILILFSCKSKNVGKETYKPKFELGIDVSAKISKIDSIENYYLIFIENEKEFYKIVSNKNQPKYHNGIKVKSGENYEFKLQPVTNRGAPSTNEKFPRPVNYLDITVCRNFDKTEICTESSYDLATASNLKGLYLRKE